MKRARAIPAIIRGTMSIAFPDAKDWEPTTVTEDFEISVMHEDWASTTEEIWVMIAETLRIRHGGFEPDVVCQRFIGGPVTRTPTPIVGTAGLYFPAIREYDGAIALIDIDEAWTIVEEFDPDLD